MGVDKSCKSEFMEIADLKLKIRKSKDSLYQERFKTDISYGNNIFSVLILIYTDIEIIYFHF